MCVYIYRDYLIYMLKTLLKIRPDPRSALTITVSLPLALLLLVSLITRAGRVQTPVHDIPQEHLLLVGQLCSGRGHETGSVGLHGVISSPREKVENL